jgi:hypothetical protein
VAAFDEDLGPVAPGVARFPFPDGVALDRREHGAQTAGMAGIEQFVADLTEGLLARDANRLFPWEVAQLT